MRFNHRVGARDQLRWNFKAQRFAGHEQRRDELRRRVATAEALPRAGVKDIPTNKCNGYGGCCRGVIL
jgi:hypothetical protein